MSAQVSPPSSVKEEDTCCDWSALRLSQCDVRSQHAIRSHTSLSPGELKANTSACQNFAARPKKKKQNKTPRSSWTCRVIVWVMLFCRLEHHRTLIWIYCDWNALIFSEPFFIWVRRVVLNAAPNQLGASRAHGFLKILLRHLGTLCSDTAAAKTEHRITSNVWEDLCFCHIVRFALSAASQK